MNRETFPQLLRHPERLSILNFEELRSLVDRYPYAQNLRFLLAKKAQLEQHPEAERLLHLAATYSIDREHLRRSMETDPAVVTTSAPAVRPTPLPAAATPADTLDLATEPVRAGEGGSGTDELTLADLERPEPERIIVAPSGLTLEELLQNSNNHASTPRVRTTPDDALDLSELETAAPVVTEVPSEPVEPIETELAELVQMDEPTVVELAPEPEPETANTTPAPAPETDGMLAAKPPTDAEQTKATDTPSRTEPEAQPEPEPLPKTAFADYRTAFLRQPGVLSVQQLMETPAPTDKAQKTKRKKQKKKAKKAKREGTKRAARTSLIDSQELASETLAQLLERQGHNEKAAAMYERLMVLHPEKSSFFAAKIKTLRT